MANENVLKHPNGTLPQDSQARKDIPMARGLLDYFPAALAAVAAVSQAGNQKHNPGEEMHHARGKSMDHADTILRHLVDRGTVDPDDGQRHSAKVAWRALALLQEELEAIEKAPLPRGARESVVVPEAKPRLLTWDEARRRTDADALRRVHRFGGGRIHAAAAHPECPVCANERERGA